MMNDPSPCSIVLRFIGHVNEGDLEGMGSLLSADVKFTDIQGRVYHEKDFMAGYLTDFPACQIHVHHALRGGSGVAIIGQTSGSHVPPEIEETETLVWTAEVQAGLISEWRIYADDAYARRS